MEHSKIITEYDLDRFAERRDSQSLVPELVNLLVTRSVPDLIDCRIPYGDKINQPGYDGRVEAANGFPPFVPNGLSYWEISSERNPNDKATETFRLRTAAMKAIVTKEELASYTFVFVTPRSAGAFGWDQQSQDTWRNKRRSEGWKAIQIIDGCRLADWAREIPAVGLWLAEKIGITPRLGGFCTPSMHWELLQQLGLSGDPPLSPKIFLANREPACRTLQAFFREEFTELHIGGESEGDVFDFVAAFLASLDARDVIKLSSRCLFIDTVPIVL